MSPLLAVALAPIAVPMRPRMAAETTAHIAPAKTAFQLIGHMVHEVPTAGRSTALSLITKTPPLCGISHSGGAEVVPALANCRHAAARSAHRRRRKLGTSRSSGSNFFSSGAGALLAGAAA